MLLKSSTYLECINIQLIHDSTKFMISLKKGCNQEIRTSKSSDIVFVIIIIIFTSRWRIHNSFGKVGDRFRFNFSFQVSWVILRLRRWLCLDFSVSLFEPFASLL